MTLLRQCRAILRLLAFVALTLACLPLAALARYLPAGWFHFIRRHWCAGVCAILGIRVTVEGQALTVCPTVILANHVSYLDIPMIGRLTRATFIAKSEVASWPLFGTIARASRTMFIRRHWRDALRQRNRLARRLGKGESFVLFAEGTSSDGLRVRPFKSSLLSVAEPWIMDKPIAVQPLTLAYCQLADETKFDQHNAETYAWVGEAALLPHLWGVLQAPGIHVTLRFGEPVMSWSVQDRKQLAARMHAHIQRNLTRIRLEHSHVRHRRHILDKIKEA